jgi:hypothetical protein
MSRRLIKRRIPSGVGPANLDTDREAEAAAVSTRSATQGTVPLAPRPACVVRLLCGWLRYDSPVDFTVLISPCIERQ